MKGRERSLYEIIFYEDEKGITQRKLETLSGVKQPVIARVENGNTTPNLSTILKILQPLGKTLAIVPIEE